MTKKSHARLVKDDLKKRQKGELANNTCWDELHGMYSTMGALFVQYSGLGVVMQNAELMNCVVDLKGLRDRILIITSDLKELKAELIAIYNTHKGRVGGPAGADIDAQALDLMHSIEVGQHYEMWLQKHNGVVLPTFNEITAALSAAEGVLKKVMSAVRTEGEETTAAIAATAAMSGMQVPEETIVA